MVSRAHALARDELVRVLVSYTGVTTANGAGDGSTLFDTNLIGVNDFVTGKAILIGSGAARLEDRGAAVFNPATGQITFSSVFSTQILAGILFRIVNISSVEALIADIEAKLDFQPVATTFVYLDAGGVQPVFTFTPTSNSHVHTVWLNLSTLTQNTTIRVNVGGITIETFNWTTVMDDGVYFRNIALDIGRAFQVTLQETADEGADRNIPYYYIYEER